MRLLGYDLTVRRDNAPISLFGGVPVDVSKAVAADLPAGASVNEAASDRLRSISRVGTSMPAMGVRPDPGQLPDATKEAEDDPLRFQFQWGTNINYVPRTGYGTPFALLRSMAAAGTVIGLCVQCRKDQMAALDWDFAPKDKKNKKLEKQIEQARTFFARPDKVTNFKTYVQVMVDEILTIDALSIYRRRNRGGGLYGYEIIDGSTIKVLLDPDGKTPLPPDIAYRQIIHGIPITGGDLTVDQLMYRPKTVRTWTPYGMSPIEMALLIATADLNRTVFNLSYFTEGNIPEALVGVPNQWSPKQISQFNAYWDLVLKGDPKNRSKLRFVTETMAKTVHEFRKPDFTTAYDLWLLKLQCACFGVTPSEIGFTDDVNKATSKSQGDVNQRRGVKPMANFIKAILDEMLATDLGLPDLEATWSGGEGEDALTQAKIVDLGIRNGRIQLNDQRALDGAATIPDLPPGLVTPQGFTPFAEPEPPEPKLPPHAGPGAPGEPPLEHQPPAEKPKPGEKVVEPTPAEKIAVATELKQYRRVALKAVRAGKRVPTFTSAVLDHALAAQLATDLTKADSVDDVQAIFAAASVTKAQRLSATQKKAEKRLHTKLGSIFSDMRKDLAAHVAHGAEGR